MKSSFINSFAVVMLLVLAMGCEPRNSVNVGRNEGMVSVEQDSRKAHNNEVTRLASIYWDSATHYQSLALQYLNKSTDAQQKALDNLRTRYFKRWITLAEKYNDTAEMYRQKSIPFIELRKKLKYK